MEYQNVLFIDNSIEEAEDVLKGLKQITGEKWTILQAVNNKKYGLIRYLRFFIYPLKILLNKKKYKNKCVVTWQQFYGIILAFYLRLFRLKKTFNLVIMTFIYRERQGIIGAIYKKFISYAIQSPYVDKVIVTSYSEIDKYSKVFNLNKDKLY